MFGHQPSRWCYFKNLQEVEPYRKGLGQTLTRGRIQGCTKLSLSRLKRVKEKMHVGQQQAIKGPWRLFTNSYSHHGASTQSRTQHLQFTTGHCMVMAQQHRRGVSPSQRLAAKRKPVFPKLSGKGEDEEKSVLLLVLPSPQPAEPWRLGALPSARNSALKATPSPLLLLEESPQLYGDKFPYFHPHQQLLSGLCCKLNIPRGSVCPQMYQGSRQQSPHCQGLPSGHKTHRPKSGNTEGTQKEAEL